MSGALKKIDLFGDRELADDRNEQPASQPAPSSGVVPTVKLISDKVALASIPSVPISQTTMEAKFGSNLKKVIDEYAQKLKETYNRSEGSKSPDKIFEEQKEFIRKEVANRLPEATPEETNYIVRNIRYKLLLLIPNH